MSNSTYNADDSRVNVIVRLVGLLFFALGVGMTVLTYSEIGADTLQPPLVPVLYLCSTMLIVAGLVALLAKYKPSTAPKP
jgi:formate-dependent nitrite reductase membrane component NrfD